MIFTYQQRSSPLHLAHAGVAAVWCGLLGMLALVADQPIVLLSLIGLTLILAALAGVGRQVRRIPLFAAPFVLVIWLINILVTRDGATVIARGGQVPAFGNLDVTLEAVVYGGVLSLRALALVLTAALFSAAVNPDALLRTVRRVSFRSALVAALTNRMTFLLARDGARIALAQRSLGPQAAPRIAVLRAVVEGALERSLDVAATLELRGYALSTTRCGVSRRRLTLRQRLRSSTRQDLAFGLSAVGLATLLVYALISGSASFDAYPTLDPVSPTSAFVVSGLVALLALAPFAVRRGVQR